MTRTGSTRRRSPFPGIADYAMLSDCEVKRAGRAERQRGVFVPAAGGRAERLRSGLDRDAGGFRLGPDEMHMPTAQRYLPGTIVLETTWGAPDGWLTVHDALLVGPLAP